MKRINCEHRRQVWWQVLCRNRLRANWWGDPPIDYLSVVVFFPLTEDYTVSMQTYDTKYVIGNRWDVIVFCFSSGQKSRIQFNIRNHSMGMRCRNLVFSGSTWVSPPLQFSIVSHLSKWVDPKWLASDLQRKLISDQVSNMEHKARYYTSISY